MPSRWWVPIPGLRPEHVRLHHIHGAVSSWFDRTSAEHSAGDKPYAVSPLTRAADGQTGVEVATFTEDATHRLAEAAGQGSAVRIGNQNRTVGRVRLLRRDTWPELLSPDGATRWRLELLTPATFRSGDRATPLPSVETILASLARAWEAWSEPPVPAPVVKPGALWVTDLDLHSELVTVQVRHRSGSTPVPVHVPGMLGTLDLRCDHPVSAAAASSLLRLAAYTGIGSMTRKGLGVARVTPLRRPGTEPGAEPGAERGGHGQAG